MGAHGPRFPAALVVTAREIQATIPTMCAVIVHISRRTSFVVPRRGPCPSVEAGVCMQAVKYLHTAYSSDQRAAHLALRAEVVSVVSERVFGLRLPPVVGSRRCSAAIGTLGLVVGSSRCQPPRGKNLPCSKLQQPA
eukprot:TRINITY_DN9341_c0_g1_i1.p1 TRINITY_DN9341_c0_g1~~TRINITY_DN9341_c0_g1_i1.p1  ORF type:complete len:137 (-),score=2.63 TRINITY_DN9341_c0_g1_i1:54-464(-)